MMVVPVLRKHKIGWLSEIQGMRRKCCECYAYRANSILLKHNAEVRQSGGFIKKGLRSRWTSCTCHPTSQAFDVKSLFFGGL